MGWLRQRARLELDATYRAEYLAKLDSILVARPDDAKARRARADLRWFEGNYGGVIEDLVVYLQHSPRDDTAWAELAEALLLQNQAQEALEAAKKAVELDPEYEDYRVLQTRSAFRAGTWEEVEKSLQAWQKLDERRLSTPRRSLPPGWPSVPRSSHPLLPLYQAALLVQQHRLEEAQKVFKEAYEKNPAVVEEEMRQEPALGGISYLYS